MFEKLTGVFSDAPTYLMRRHRIEQSGCDEATKDLSLRSRAYSETAHHLALLHRHHFAFLDRQRQLAVLERQRLLAE